MAAVSELDIHRAVKAAVIAAASRVETSWFATPGLAIHFGRQAPNAAQPPYLVVSVEEQDDPDPESDGCIAQRFNVEIMARTVGPTDTEAASAALVSLDPTWDGEQNFTIANTDQGVVGVRPKAGKLRLIEPLIAGADQYTTSRRWEVWTAAYLGTLPQGA